MTVDSLERDRDGVTCDKVLLARNQTIDMAVVWLIFNITHTKKAGLNLLNHNSLPLLLRMCFLLLFSDKKPHYCTVLAALQT